LCLHCNIYCFPEMLPLHPSTCLRFHPVPSSCLL
jgi:hypothetical protein